ncbi:Scr1 family TA system antitoxin-like transcriptional regulator [Spirillospora sp. CA-255316]
MVLAGGQHAGDPSPGKTAAEDVQRLHDLARQARETAWWDAYSDDLSHAFRAYVGFEAGAAALFEAQGLVIPGLLQIPDYAREFARGVGWDKTLTERAVKFRMRRQQELSQRAVPLRQRYVLDEAGYADGSGATTTRTSCPRSCSTWWARHRSST